uniref:Carboxylesterase type B domain-containing protein n=1 Tax=Meloidogyne floridensis TaxID=298350 RepID=A0A915PBX8_9BILA
MLFFFVLLVDLSAGGFSTSNFFSNDGHQQQHNSYNNHQQQNVHSTNTPFGIVRGIKVWPSGMPKADVSLSPVVQYLGIPYGSAPVGNHRFKMPISAPKWIHQPKDAFKSPPSCIQSGLPLLSESEALKVTTAQRFDRLHRILSKLKFQSEDCLFLNLFVPEKDKFRDAQPLPVLVLIHGDTDYGWGGANAFNATLLASFGQIVVVTLNYRLGVFGFLGRCDLNSCAGNAGLSDLVAALKMLSLILPSFGADPDAVTLLGWESGAALVSLLMASPITQPKGRLFRRAVLLDGTALSPWAMANNPQDQFIQLARILQCSSNSEGEDFINLKNQKEFISRLLECMQEQNLQNLTNAAKKVSNLSPTFLRTVQHPAQHLIADQDMQNGLNIERRDKILRTLVRNIFDFHRSEILQAILNEYTDWENPKNHSKSMRNGLMEILGDLLFTAPLIETAKAHSLDEGPIKAANTFFFVFTHETNAWMKEQPNSGLQGSFTGDHLPYILGHPFTAGGDLSDGSLSTNKLLQFSPEDKQISRVMMTFMANFVKSGDPTRPLPMSSQSNIEDRFQGLPWPQFSSQTREAYLEISTRPRVKNYYRNSNVQFWNGFIPILNKRGDKDIPEEHHFLPNHFDRSSFFGQPRPFSTYHNFAFPPPPMPPTPFPKELRNKLIAAYTIPPTSTIHPTQISNESPNKQPENNLIENTGKAGLLFLYNPTWGWLILFGVGLTAINLCILVIFSKKCARRNSNSKKKFNYQSYSTSSNNNNNLQQPLPGLDMNFAALPQQKKALISNNNHQHTYLSTTSYKTNKRHSNCLIDDILETDFSTKKEENLLNNELKNNNKNKINCEKIKNNKIEKEERKPPYLLTPKVGGSWYPEPKKPEDIRIFGIVIGNQELNKTTKNNRNYTNNYSDEQRSRAATLHLLSTYGRRINEEGDKEVLKKEPLLSTTTSSCTKGGGVSSSNPSMCIPQQQHHPSGLIHLGPGISPTCPRHGRAAQMLLAAAAANRSGGIGVDGGGISGGNIPSTTITTPPALQMNLNNNNSIMSTTTQKIQANINNNNGSSSLNGGAFDGNGSNGQQKQRTIEEVQSDYAQ